jgi:formyltetrahydrofolate synthetase
MPTNNVENALAATADCFEDILRNDLKLRDALAALLKNNQKPNMFRLLDNTLAGGVLTLTVDTQANLTR